MSISLGIARRRLLPMSRAALWSLRFAVTGAMVAVIAVVTMRLDWLDPLRGLSVLASGLGLAVLGGATAILGFVSIWKSGAPGLTSAIRALLVAGVTLAYPAWISVEALLRPQLNDIITDLSDPLSFSRSRAAQAARVGHVPPESTPEMRALQARFYPDIEPVMLDMPADQAFTIVRKAVANLGWRVVEETPPSIRQANGRLEAIALSPVLRLPDDITIRVRGLPEATRVDIRSTSRYGRHDMGTNAARIARFADELTLLAQARN